MGVDHSGSDIVVAKKLLHRSNIIPVFEQVSRKGMAESDLELTQDRVLMDKDILNYTKKWRKSKMLPFRGNGEGRVHPEAKESDLQDYPPRIYPLGGVLIR